MWPFCRQPLYATAMPVVFNATILNGLGLVGALEGPPTWAPADAGGQLLDVRFEHSEQLWPWSGFLALYLRVKDEGAAFSGTASGEVTFTVVSPPGPGEAAPRKSTVRVPLTAAIVPTPPRCVRGCAAGVQAGLRQALAVMMLHGTEAAALGACTCTA